MEYEKKLVLRAELGRYIGYGTTVLHRSSDIRFIVVRAFNTIEAGLPGQIFTRVEVGQMIEIELEIEII